MQAVHIPGLRRMVVIGLAMLVVLGVIVSPRPSAGADEQMGEATPIVIPEVKLTELTVVGTGSRSVSYDGSTGRFVVSVLRDSLITAVSDGNKTVKAIADAIAEKCTKEEPKDADHTAAPTCISPNGLQTVDIRIQEEYDWTEQGRVSRGFRYDNHLEIAIRGTGFAGGLVDMIITAGGNNVRLENLRFTSSRRAEVERLAMLDAIDDARSTARNIAKHMGYSIERIVKVTRTASFDPYGGNDIARAESLEGASDESVPTPVFGGAQVVTSRITMVFELKPPPRLCGGTTPC